MAAPRYVPARPGPAPRTYSSPPRRPESWVADRPGDLEGRQPVGEQLGSQGPDQGYVLALAERFRDRIVLADGEQADDALAGAAVIALKRASGYGRAPVIHDMAVGLGIWGFLDHKPPRHLVELRREMFEEAHHPHHYVRLREIADAVPADVLHQPHEAILSQASDNWSQVIQVG